ncbi:hypothetical protein HQ563_00370 [bacterium]|nr:hypothetical protein [bacterium]
MPGTDTDPGDFHFTPPVYPRPGKALDGGPKFELGRPTFVGRDIYLSEPEQLRRIPNIVLVP